MEDSGWKVQAPQEDRALEPDLFGVRMLCLRQKQSFWIPKEVVPYKDALRMRS
jgi:hypothetical protein